MRHSNLLSSSQYYATSNNECTNTEVKDKSFNQQKCSDNSTRHSFIHCSWDNNGRSSSGGAIHLRCTYSQPSITLTVDRCIFFHCHETGNIGGGRVYAEYIGTTMIRNSFFYDCQCGTGADGPDGAGALLNYIHTFPLIQCCIFLFCTSGDDGGGCGIWNSQSPVSYAVDSCTFLKCKGVHQKSTDGGGIIFNQNIDMISCTNCLFHACTTPHYGGAISAVYPSGTTIKPISFCYFHQNTAEYGNDIFLYCFPDPSQTVLHCLSTSASDRVCSVLNENDISNPDKFKSDSDWLPLGTLSYLNTWNGTDDPYPDNDPNNPVWLSEISGDDAEQYQ